MASPAEMQAQIDALTLELRDLHDQIPGAIADALRTFADRPVGEKGAPSLQFGVVEEVFDTHAAVTLDGQVGSVPINMLGGLVAGERVAVLLVPPSGNLAIGMVTPSVVPPTSAGGFPVGPLDDGNAVYLIQVDNGTFPQSILASTVDDTTGVTGLVAVVGQNADGGVILSGSTPDGGTAVLLVDAQEAAFAQIGLSVNAAGAGNLAQIQLSSVAAGSSSALVSAADVSLTATNSIAVGSVTTVLLGFYGAAGVAQAATPTTLAQVITILQNLGLCA